MPQYEAISYVWGSNQRNHKIRSAGRIINITANLDIVLQRIRLSTAPRILWADSICINQEDVAERGKQVELMGKIYSKASQVLMYIGSDNDGHGEAVASLVSELDVMILREIERAGHSWNAFPSLSAEERGRFLADRRWNSLLIMTQQPWFGRGWIIQEAALSTNGLMIWGTMEISWRKLVRIYAWMINRLPEIRTMYQDGMNRLHVEMYRMRNKFETMSLYPVTPAVFDFLVILHDARALSLGDPRDRVYAFLSLANDAKVNIRLQPDYSDTTTALDVYFRMAREYIESIGDINLLHCVQHTEATIEAHFPSWVPRWDLNLFDNIVTHTSASTLIPLNVQPILSSGNILKTFGVIFDQVAFRSNLCSRNMSVDDISSIWATISERDAVSAYGSYHRAIAFAHVLSLGRSWSVPWQKWRKNHLTTDEEQGVKYFHTYAQWNIYNRRIIMTKRGYYGLAPLAVRENDVCCVFLGGKAPCILRATARSGYYTFVGDACIPSKTLHKVPQEIEALRLSSIGSKGYRDWENWGIKEQNIFLC
ncbi:hypothetical protein ACMFMG_008361 [Clarireedia jacksonii]